jgi:hypothetical protein
LNAEVSPDSLGLVHGVLTFKSKGSDLLLGEVV